MEHILPSMLEGFEKQKFIPSGTLSKWTEVISSSNYSAHSLKQLNERGRNLLERSGMKEIVDTQFDQLSEKLVERGWKSLNEIESQAFYVLKELENEDSAVPIKDYLYDHQEESLDTVFFVGAIYLRERYLEEHPDIAGPTELSNSK